jgi:lysophospholipase L1-like esterase
VTGTGFGASQGSSTVAVNGVQATTVLSWSDTSVTFVVPAGATTGKVSVTTTGGTAFSAANYSVTVSGPVNGTYQHLSATNSLGTGFPQSMVLDANSYPTFVQALLDPAVWKVGGGLGQGYPSQTADSIRGHLPEILAFKLSTVTATLIGVEAGINDLRNGATAQQAYAAVKRLCQAIITGGCIPFVYTTPINRYAGDANIDAAQAEFNNLIVNGIADLQAAFVVAIHTEPRLMTLSTDVQQDGLHWTPAARRDIVAPMGASGLNRWATGERNFVVYGSGAPAAPAAPTFVDYNDVTDIAQYATPFTPDKIEYTLDNGVTWITPGPSDNIIHVGDVAKPYGYVQSRVRALGGAPPSAPLKYPSFQAGIPRLPNSPGDPQPYAFIYPKQGVSALQDYRGANAGPKAVVSPALVLDAFGTGKPGWQYPAGGFMLDIFDIAGTREGTYIHTNQLASYDTKQILFEQGSDAASTPNAFTAYIEGRQLYVRKYRADGGYAQTVAPITTADGTPLVFGLIISDDPAQTPLQLTVNHVSPGVYSDPAGGGLGDFVNLPFYMGARQGGAFACVGLFRGLQNFKQYQSGSYAASWDAYAESLTSTAGGTSTGGGTGGGTGDVPASFYAAPQNIEDNSGKFTYTGAYQQVDYTDYSGGHTYYLSPGASGLATLDKPVQAAYLGFFEGTTTANAVAVLVQIRTYTAAGTATWINLGVVTNEAGGVRKLALPSATGYYEVRLSNDPAHPGSFGLCDLLQLLQS